MTDAVPLRCRIRLHRWLPRQAFGVYSTDITGEVCSRCAARRLVGFTASSNPLIAQRAMHWLHEDRKPVRPNQPLVLVKGMKP